MEKENENILLKSRSSQACIRDGYRFFTANFRRIFRITWPVAVGYAILSAAASALPVLISPSLLLPGAILATIAVILLLVTADWLLHKRQVMQQFGKLPFSAWFRHLGMVLLVTIVCLFVVSVMALFIFLTMQSVEKRRWA